MRELNGSVRSPEELIRFNEENEAESGPPGKHGQDHLIRASNAPGRSSAKYKRTAEILDELTQRRGLGDLFSTHKIDALDLRLQVEYPALWTASAGFPSVGSAPGMVL